MIRIWLRLSALVPIVIVLGACGSPEPTATTFSAATPEFVPSTIAAQQVASPTPASVGTPVPTKAETPTPVPSPQGTLEPTSTPGPGSLRVGETNFSLTLPEGFQISLFTTESIGPLRFMAFSPDGVLFVTLPSRLGLYSDWRGGKVLALPDRDQDGVADEVRVAIGDLRDSPHGLAFHEGYLYLAEHSTVSRYQYLGNGEVGGMPEVVTDLPFGRGHLSRTIGFSSFDKMYVSIGSSCNVCEESDQRRATVMEYNPDGSGERVFAEGLRNSVGFVFQPGTGEIWATENGRDNLGDDLPPDEINILRNEQNYGWPYCYGKNIPDPAFGESNKCNSAQESTHDLQAHSAPLGLRFVESAQFPEEWQGDLLVAYHGSWNRSVPTGYKVVRLDVEGSGVVGEEDFISGWMLDNGKSVGRPVDLIFGPEDGALYISDDKAGVIYRMTRDQ